jgi:hypothetical protein
MSGIKKKVCSHGIGIQTKVKEKEESEAGKKDEEEGTRWRMSVKGAGCARGMCAPIGHIARRYRAPPA